VAYIQWISWSGGPGAASSAADSELPYPNTFLMPLFGLSAANYAAFMAHRRMYSVASVSSVSVAYQLRISSVSSSVPILK
jgi:hypothetical protein